MSNTTLALSFRMFQDGQLIREDTLTQGVIKIGKVPSAHLQIADDAVSRMHAIIEVTRGEVSLIDLGSTRGTFVNGKRINKARLQSGDAITLGDTRLELVIGDPVPVHASPTAIVPPPLPPALRRPSPPPAGTAPVALPAPDVTTKDVVRVVVDEAYRHAASLATSPPLSRLPLIVPDEQHREPATGDADRGSPHGRREPIQEAQIVTAIADAGWATTSFVAVPREPSGPRGARTVEIAAMLGDTVVDVKHCTDPRGGRVSPATWAIFAGGVACLVAAAAAFTLSVRNAAANQIRLDTWTRVEHKPAWAFRPAQLGADADWIAFGGLALGLAGMTFGVARVRRGKPSPYYRIGTAPGVELAIQGAPAAAFPLVAPSGDDFVFNYGPGIDGELILDGNSTALSELVATGRSRPSAAIAGAIEVPIPLHARILARAGHTTFVVSAVEPPRRHLASLLRRSSGRGLAYVAGSLVAHLVVLAIVFASPPDESTINVDSGALEDLGIPVRIAASEERPPDTAAGGLGATGTQASEAPAMALPPGAAGLPGAKPDGHLQVARTRDEPPQISRDEALARARRDGILGSELWLDGIKLASATSDYTNGFDETDVNGPLFGADGSGRGTFGGGLSGFSVGGGCTADPCGTFGTRSDGTGGTMGTGRYATIGPGRYSGYGPGARNSGGPGWRPHPQTVPRTGEPQIPGTYDKKIVRRYIRHHLNEIAYCYDKQLLARPDLGGEITIRFFIAPGGNVQGATGTGFDREVASCLSDVIGNIAFPPPGDGGVQVTYPFQFHTTGH